MQPDVSHGRVYVDVTGQTPDREFIVQWDDVAHHPDSDGATFQLVMHEDDDLIVMRYRDVDFQDVTIDGGASATVGVQFDATHGTQLSFDTPSLTNESAIAFYTDHTMDMTVSPSVASVLPGDSTTYQVDVDYLDGSPVDVSLSVSGLPLGATANFSPSNGHLSQDQGMTSQLVIDTDLTILPGNHPITITATTSLNSQETEVTLQVGPPISYGLLRVETVPAVATVVHLDGIPRNDWTLSWLKLPPGHYQLSFTDVQGFVTPETVSVKDETSGVDFQSQSLSEPIEIQPGTTTLVQATFIETGNLKVETDPPVQSMTSVWSVDEQVTVAGDNWGLWVDLAPGDYLVSLTDVLNHQTPDTIDVTYDWPSGSAISQSITVPMQVRSGETTLAKASFIEYGNLRVDTIPALAATIYLDGQPMSDWGIWVNLLPESYTVSFEDVAGFTTPPPLGVTVNTGLTTHVVGDYNTGETSLLP